MTSTTYQVTGMTCEHCARAVTQELRDVPGVTTVTVALVPGGQSAVTVTSDTPLTAAAVATALDEAGDYRLTDDADDGDADGTGDAGGPRAGRGVAAPATARTLPVV